MTALWPALPRGELLRAAVENCLGRNYRASGVTYMDRTTLEIEGTIYQSAEEESPDAPMHSALSKFQRLLVEVEKLEYSWETHPEFRVHGDLVRKVGMGKRFARMLTQADVTLELVVP